LLGTAIVLSNPAFAQQATTPVPAADSAAIVDPEQFVTMASIGNTFEIASSTEAKERSQNADVLAFADQMVADHTKAAQELTAAAGAESLTPADDLDEKHQEILDGLTDADDAAFDAAYIVAQVQAHDETVALFEGYSANGPAGALKDFATKTLPTLKMHQEHAHALSGH